MKKLMVIIWFFIIGQSAFAQTEPDFVKNFTLPGLTGSVDYSPLIDSVAVVEAEGWNVLVLGYYNLSQYTESTLYDNLKNKILEKDSVIIIGFFKVGQNLDFDILVQSSGGNANGSIATEIHNYLLNNAKSYDGQNMVQRIAEALSLAKHIHQSSTFRDACTSPGRNGLRSSRDILNAAMVTTKDAFFMSLSGVPVFVPSGSKVEFFTCNASVNNNVEAPAVSINARGVLMNFTKGGKTFSPGAKAENGQWIFSGYRSKVKNNEGTFIYTDYIPPQTFVNGGVVYLAFFGDDCEKVLIKELEHVNSIVSNKPNKHGGELVDIETLYPNFVRELRSRIRIDGTEELYFGGFEHSTINVCPPTIVEDGLKLVQHLSGAKYIESFYNGDLIIYHSSVGSYAQYHDETSEPKYLKWDKNLNAWISVEVDDGVFFNQFKAGAENFLTGFAYVAILGSNLASGGVGLGAASILGVELTTAGAMYVMDGDQNSLIMDLVLAPIGAAASVAQDAAKLGNALVDASKAADLKSATHLGLMANKGIAATNDIKIVDKAGNFLDWKEIKKSVNEIVGPDISKFANDFATIATQSGKHLDLLACSVSSGARGNGSGTRSGGCNYPLVKAWKVLLDDADLRKVVGNLEKVDGHLAKNIHTAEELETAFKAASNKAKWVDDIGYNVLRKADGKVEYINPNGKIIKWTSQDPNNFSNQINTAINSGDAGRIAEGEAAQAVLGQKPLEGFGLERKLDGQAAAELDIVTADEIIEVKANITLAKDKFPSQIPKLKDSGIDKYVNPRDKPVILHVKEPLPINPNTGTFYPSDQQFIDDLLNNYNIQFSNSLTELTSKLQ